MLLTVDSIRHVLDAHHIHITGILHIGAHNCEEIGIYQTLGISPERVVWIDAYPAKVEEAKLRNIPNVYHAVISDKDDTDVTFHVSNNVQSSSILEFGTHATEHPDVVYIDVIPQKSTTIPTFFLKHNLDPANYTLWNLDIQGAELLALKGAESVLQYVTALYLEVNEAELYKGCGQIGEIDAFLKERGFERVLTQMTRHGWGDALYIRSTRLN